MAPLFWATYFERLAILAGILATLYFVAHKVREARFFARGRRRLSVVESVPVAPHAALHIVQAGRRYFLVGSAAEAITRVAELSERDLDKND